MDSIEGQGQQAMAKYLTSQTAQSIPNLQPYLLIFRKDRCVRKITQLVIWYTVLR